MKKLVQWMQWAWTKHRPFVIAGLLVVALGAATTPAYLPTTGGKLTGPLTAPSIGGCVYASGYSTLAAAIAATPSGGTLCMPAGTYTVALSTSTTLTIANSISIVGMGARQAQIQITGSPNVAFTIAAANVRFYDLDISGQAGQTFSVIGQTGFALVDSNVHGTASQLYAGNCSAAVYLQGGSDHWIQDDVFTNSGISPVTGYSYGLCANFDVNGTNYSTARVHVRGNWFYGNTMSFPVSLFNCDSCDAEGNTIDQGNNYDGATQGYGLEFYNNNEGVCGTLGRASGVVTCLWSGGTSPALQYPVGAPILVHQATASTNGTSFSGVFTVTSSSSAGITWNQPAPDDTGGSTAASVNFGYGHLIVANNQISNCAGNCIYEQSVTSSSTTGNLITNAALQMPDTSLCQAGISLAGWMLNATGNTILNSTKSGICDDGSYDVIGPNIVSGAGHFGYYLRGARYLSISGGNLSGATPAAIGGDLTATADAYHLLVSGVSIQAAPSQAALYFAGPDSYITIASLQIKAPSSVATSPNEAVLFTSSSAAHISILNTEIDCSEDQSTATPPTPGFSIGIDVSGSAFVVSGNRVQGCNSSGGFGIIERATGVNNTYTHNRVSGSHTAAVAIEVLGTSPHVWFNELAIDNSTPLSCGSATTPDCTQNLISATGTLPLALGQLPATIPSGYLPPQQFSYMSGNLTAVPTTVQGPLIFSPNGGLTLTQFTIVTNAYTCSAQPQIELYDLTAAAALAGPYLVPSTTTPPSNINGTGISVAVPAAHKVMWLFTTGTCTALNVTATVNS